MSNCNAEKCDSLKSYTIIFVCPGDPKGCFRMFVVDARSSRHAKRLFFRCHRFAKIDRCYLTPFLADLWLDLTCARARVSCACAHFSISTKWSNTHA